MRDAGTRLAVASYNVHRCIGRDRRHDPGRIAAVVAELRADVIGLQEVHCRSGHPDDVDQLAYLAEAGGFAVVSGPTLRTSRGHCGNAILTRHPVLAVRHLDLTVGGAEGRGALDVDLAVDGRRVRVTVTHLGLRGRYRRVQVARLLAALGSDRRTPVVVLGDMNEWLPFGTSLRRLHARLGRSRGRRSFPSLLPLLALDRIWAQPQAALQDVRVHRSPLARVASDHLPVRAELELGSPARLPAFDSPPGAARVRARSA